MTQRDGTGREVGGGFRMGNMCTPVADSCSCMAKPMQYCKVKKKGIIKLEGKFHQGEWVFVFLVFFFFAFFYTFLIF